MINLFTSYYKDKNEERQKEIDFCLEKNIKNTFINRVYILSEVENIPFNDDKIEIILHKRPTFKDFFIIINNVSNDKDFNILTNSDIFLDETVKEIKNIMNKSMVLSLLRWEYGENPKINIMRSDCQDTWIWIGKMKELEYSDFYLGKLGCDNRIAWEFKNKGFILRNPCSLIKTYHVHNTNVRNYKETLVGQKDHINNKDVVEKPYYYVNPI
jgi:hypothetical protein